MRNILKSAAALGFVAVIGTSLLTGVDALTADRIAAQERRVILEQLGQIIPREYDNSLLEDRMVFSDENHFPKGQLVTAYRARLNNKPVAVVLKFNAVSGYNGHIALLAGINFDGTLRGVRVISHKETPGLGDAIEVEKSNWINDFEGKSLKKPESSLWAVKRDGGSFDQFTGATITPRAVVDAVKLALEYFETNRQFLFEAAADPSGSSAP
jgi:Na+-translocating ferredoxin:NAD+ oxidoreductase subunit G